VERRDPARFLAAELASRLHLPRVRERLLGARCDSPPNRPATRVPPRASATALQVASTLLRVERLMQRAPAAGAFGAALLDASLSARIEALIAAPRAGKGAISAAPGLALAAGGRRARARRPGSPPCGARARGRTPIHGRTRPALITCGVMRTRFPSLRCWSSCPGLIVTQHSGDGKANQYFLRGFNLDHGTDFATSVDGIPVNMPTHAHGQGYTDLNFLLPELVQRIDYRKGGVRRSSRPTTSCRNRSRP
jgi:hypothetical protein